MSLYPRGRHEEAPEETLSNGSIP